jgi:hypothetical protein
MDDLLEPLFRGIIRFFIYIFVDLIFEIGVKGVGFLIVRTYRKRPDIDPDGFEVALLGLLFWIVVITLFVIVIL